MALVIPPGFGLMTWRFSLTGDPEFMATTCGVDLGEWVGDFQTAVGEMRGDFTAAFPAGEIADGWTFQGGRLYVGQDGGPPAIFEAPTPLVGTAVTQNLPNNCAILVKKLTASAGRANRGRMFLPAFNAFENLIDAKGMLDGGFRASVQTKVDAWLETPAREYRILHDSLSPVITPTPINNFVVDQRIATQRRRLRG